jgi:TonB family protein
MKALMRKAAVAAFLFIAIIPFTPPNCRAQESAENARKVLIKTQAAYPIMAQSMNLRGVVKLEAQVEPNGTVKAVTVKGGHPILAQSAVTAVGHWKFEPAAHETKEMIEIKFDPQ